MFGARRSIRRTLIIGVIIFVISLCLLLSHVTNRLFSNALYERYQTMLTNVLTYVEHNIDADDLAVCLETGEKSEKYTRTQAFLNNMIDDLGLAYLYVVIPGEDCMYNAISATSAEEFASGMTDMEIMEISDAYTKEELEKYRSFWEAEEVNYFEESSEWGAFYTGVLPIRDSGGNTVAIACADIPIEALHKSIRDYLIASTVIIIIICGLFAVALLAWIRKGVTGPVLALEKSANDFAEKSSHVSDYRELKYDRPVIKTQNEIQSLASAVAKMADDMILYIDRILKAEERAHTAELDARTMTEVAYHDALTHVKSKVAYDDKAAEINQKIAEGNAEFAIVMVDLNNLKRMNDTYGHDNGDKYLVGACSLICGIYVHSPVYRIGGDEFVAVLENHDYRKRDELFKKLGEAFYASRIDESKDPWERYSAAGGMAVYSGAEGELFEDVFKLADERMYADKQDMKSQGLL